MNVLQVGMKGKEHVSPLTKPFKKQSQLTLRWVIPNDKIQSYYPHVIISKRSGWLSALTLGWSARSSLSSPGQEASHLLLWWSFLSLSCQMHLPLALLTSFFKDLFWNTDYSVFFTSSWEHNSINHITILSRKFSMGTNEFLCYFLNNTVTAALQWLIWILLGDDVTKNMPHANTYTHTGLHKFATIKSTSWAMLLAHE